MQLGHGTYNFVVASMEVYNYVIIPLMQRVRTWTRRLCTDYQRSSQKEAFCFFFRAKDLSTSKVNFQTLIARGFGSRGADEDLERDQDESGT